MQSNSRTDPQLDDTRILLHLFRFINHIVYRFELNATYQPARVFKIQNYLTGFDSTWYWGIKNKNKAVHMLKHCTMTAYGVEVSKSE
jgi:hypothetical protein